MIYSRYYFALGLIGKRFTHLCHTLVLLLSVNRIQCPVGLRLDGVIFQHIFI